ncbi:MAG: DHH family phosphoesterase [Candidatus Micrarchaeota archaeon]|nr:DHH family phosphoesterase [Candidatus Micrarchaeota archaeon]
MARFPKISSKRIIITFHSGGDLDAVGGAIALSRALGRKAVIAAPDKPASAARKLLDYTGTPYSLFPEIKRAPNDFIIVLDSSSPQMLAHLTGIQPDLMVDHHSRLGGEVAAKKVINDPSASSTCEILYFMLKPKDRLSCIALLLGIISDSANFKSATPATFRAASDLLARSAISYSELLSLSHAPDSFSERLEAVRSCASVSAERAGEHIIALAMAKSHEAHFADILVSLGADAAFVGCEAEDGRISARARDSLRGQVRLDRIMSEVGKVMGGSGGGHETAAAATGEKGSVRESLAVCKKFAEQQILSSERAKIRKIEW